MKLIKSLLLGSAAGLAAVAGAQAADLPAKKAAPVEYVKVCSTYGAGFFYIPGTDTCLSVSGRVRAEYLYATPRSRADDADGFYTRGRVQLDARTATAYGLLRSVVRFEITRTSGTPFRGPGDSGSIGEGADVNEAFVQFGGLTAGRVTSFFSNGDLPTGHFGTLRFDDSPDVDLLAYTFTFGNGFSASLSVEDGLERRNNDLLGFDDPRALKYAGQRMPDLVGNIKYTGTWGTAQLSGAVHQMRSLNAYTVGGFSAFPDSEYGFAVSATAGINLPSLAPGDALWVAATYADGALGYLNGGNSPLSSDPLTAANDYLGLTDGYINPVTGDIKRGRGGSIAGGVLHYWTPQLRSNIFGSYLRVDYSNDGVGTAATGYTTGLTDFNEWRLGGNLIWQPVSGLDLGVEAIYVRLDPHNRVLLPAGGTFGSDNALETRLRIQRDF